MWCKILTAVPNSILWLLRFPALAAPNIYAAAAAEGVAAERIVFMDVAEKAPYVARGSLADICLDCPACNGHTTGTDVLWAGVPMVTMQLETMCSRVAGSLCEAIECPEMIAADSDDYVRLSVELATDRPRLLALRRKLWEKRLTTPLFNTRQWTREWEASLLAVWARHCADLKPDHIHVAKLSDEELAEVAEANKAADAARAEHNARQPAMCMAGLQPPPQPGVAAVQQQAVGLQPVPMAPQVVGVPMAAQAGAVQMQVLHVPPHRPAAPPPPTAPQLPATAPTQPPAQPPLPQGPPPASHARLVGGGSGAWQPPLPPLPPPAVAAAPHVPPAQTAPAHAAARPAAGPIPVPVVAGGVPMASALGSHVASAHVAIPLGAVPMGAPGAHVAPGAHLAGHAVHVVAGHPVPGIVPGGYSAYTLPGLVEPITNQPQLQLVPRPHFNAPTMLPHAPITAPHLPHPLPPLLPLGVGPATPMGIPMIPPALQPTGTPVGHAPIGPLSPCLSPPAVAVLPMCPTHAAGGALPVAPAHGTAQPPVPFAAWAGCAAPVVHPQHDARTAEHAAQQMASQMRHCGQRPQQHATPRAVGFDQPG